VDLLTATVAQRPDLAPLLGDLNPWPRFMCQDPVGSLYYADPATAYPEFVLVAVDRDHPAQLVASCTGDGARPARSGACATAGPG
jgi:hypothetical protein